MAMVSSPILPWEDLALSYETLTFLSQTQLEIMTEQHETSFEGKRH